MPAAGLVHAPGKLVILGEYAVLDGGPALATAVHRGVGCEVGPAGDVLVETPADDRFVRAALTALSAPPARYRFFDLDPAAVPGKPGFGGSAAATVAAVIAAGGRGEEAYRIHREVQGGGSGVDVAASLHGGTLRFEGGAVEALDPVRPAVVHAGHPSSTAPRVAAYRAWRGWREDFTRRSAEIVAVFDRDPIAALDEAATLLERMAGAAGIDYLTPALERIRALAREHGGAAKPSGAGGGDCAVALFACPESEVAFLARCAALGLPPIPVRVAAPAGWRVAPPAGEHRA